PSPQKPQHPLAELIDQQHQIIEQRWLQRVQQDVARREGLSPTALRDGIAHYLTAIARTLRDRSPITLVPRSHDAWSDVAKEHGITRVRIGFDVVQLVHEFIVLRQIIIGLAAEHGVHEGLDQLTDIIEVAISVAVGSYVQARDYEARRRQA